MSSPYFTENEINIREGPNPILPIKANLPPQYPWDQNTLIRDREKLQHNFKDTETDTADNVLTRRQTLVPIHGGSLGEGTNPFWDNKPGIDW
jgi:hypothetical protein